MHSDADDKAHVIQEKLAPFGPVGVKNCSGGNRFSSARNSSGSAGNRSHSAGNGSRSARNGRSGENSPGERQPWRYLWELIRTSRTRTP